MEYAGIEATVNNFFGEKRYVFQWVGSPYARVKVHESLLLKHGLSEIFPFPVGKIATEGNAMQWNIYARKDGRFLISFSFWLIWERLTKLFWRGARAVYRVFWHAGFLDPCEACEMNFFADWRWDFRKTLQERERRNSSEYRQDQAQAIEKILTMLERRETGG